MTVFASGGCLCGGVRYECSAEPIMQGTCHCRDCQRATGSAFATLVIFPLACVAVSGPAYAVYTHRGESGQEVRRGHCRECGAPILVEYDVTPDFAVVMAGTLDDVSLIAPQWNIYTASKQPWVHLPAGTKTFEGGFRTGG